jgi:uncharacterized protein with ParB-like and HNH nuclease domain
MKIESRDQSVGDLLTSGYYVIPRFQRPCSWDSENIADFWNDTVVNRSNDYFIGSMVVYTMGDRKFGVVDGQQRLTTIMILLRAVRDELQRRGSNDPKKGSGSFFGTPGNEPDRFFQTVGNEGSTINLGL